MSNSYLNSALIFFFSVSISFGSHASAVKPEEQLQTFLTQNIGHVVYVDFWASWCVPCRKSFPWMADMQNKFRDQGFRVVTINVDAEHHLAEEFLTENVANFPVIFDPQGKVAETFKLKGMPSSFVFDRAGKIKYSHVGFFSNKQKSYELELTRLLSEK